MHFYLKTVSLHKTTWIEHLQKVMTMKDFGIVAKFCFKY